ncbi:endonuclease/exonuclease/phosphatase family protein [Novosphingobium sp.]|uniref:endonuclease/exonuclease/phosphatase family protein n=1 Tax=Novosphingobium sp. TaxID=1874826 RepID=UPI002B47B7ED|nr:endonuclease/exonuclease/phosphatase family protein [Novosphingobium sp.]HKR91558.1 endonuclease/exonuclease/phosphatase family protein [Novosphingobium sp.]
MMSKRLGASTPRRGLAPSMRRTLRLRLIAAAALLAGALILRPLSAPGIELAALPNLPASACQGGDISVLTYNVAGLPWPLAKKGAEALHAIGERLAWMHARGCAPSVVVLQEAFSRQAKAIAGLSGYRFVVEGPNRRSGAWPNGVERSWTLGETEGTPVDSGLMVLSDLPVLNVKKAAFPEGACAGYDCLAAKGVVLVTLELPGGRKVLVSDTHFNSKGESYASAERTIDAYRREAYFLARFVAANRPAGAPVIMAGDFNQGQRAARIAVLQSALDGLAGHSPVDALRACAGADPQLLARSADARWITWRARDLQFVLNGKAGSLTPMGAEVPFGTERDGSMLSDHMGYTIRYRYSA